MNNHKRYAKNSLDKTQYGFRKGRSFVDSDF